MLHVFFKYCRSLAEKQANVDCAWRFILVLVSDGHPRKLTAMLEGSNSTVISNAMSLYMSFLRGAMNVELL